MIRGSLFRDFEFFQNIQAFNNWWAPQAANWGSYWRIPRLNAEYWQCIVFFTIFNSLVFFVSQNSLLFVMFLADFELCLGPICI